MKSSWTGHTSRNVEDSGVQDSLNCGDKAQEVSETINICPRIYFVDIFVKNVPISSLVKKNLLETKLKSFELAALAEELWNQYSFDYVVWLLVATHMQI